MSNLDNILLQYGLDNDIDYSPYNGKPIYNFSPVLYLQTGNLSLTGTGIAVHKNKDVSFDFYIKDRDLNVLETTDSVIKNYNVKSINISILDVSGNIVSDNFVKDSFQSSFIFTESDNINLFGKYQPNFGIRANIISDNDNIQSTDYYVYGNTLEFEDITINDSQGKWIIKNPYDFYTGYEPFNQSGFDVEVLPVTTNYLHWSNYNLNIDNFTALFSGKIEFPIINGESIYINWGDSSDDYLIFQQTGIDYYSGSGVTQSNTLYNNPYFTGIMNSGPIVGKTYDFYLSHYYESGSQINSYDINFYYSGNDSTGKELIKNMSTVIPYTLNEKGSKISDNQLTGEIKFDFNFRNDMNTVTPYYVEMYSDKNLAVASIDDHFISRFDMSGINKKQSFSFFGNKLQTNQDIYFRFSPYSNIGRGYSWLAGPYIFKPIASVPPTSISTDRLTVSNDTYSMEMQLITGVITGFNSHIIDTIIKDDPYFAYEYLTRFDDYKKHYCANKLMIVDNTSGLDLNRTGLSFTESAISDNSFISFDSYEDNNNIYLTARHDYSLFSGIQDENDLISIYKIQKTSI